MRHFAALGNVIAIIPMVASLCLLLQYWFGTAQLPITTAMVVVHVLGAICALLMFLGFVFKAAGSRPVEATPVHVSEVTEALCSKLEGLGCVITLANLQDGTQVRLLYFPKNYKIRMVTENTTTVELPHGKHDMTRIQVTKLGQVSILP